MNATCGSRLGVVANLSNDWGPPLGVFAANPAANTPRVLLFSFINRSSWSKSDRVSV